MKHQQLFGSAQWVSPGASTDTPYIRSCFTAKKPSKAVITICGLGFFELYINGSRISDDLYVSLSSDFHENPDYPAAKRHGEELAHRIYCMQYDITEALCDGQNCIGVMLAPGWYTSVVRYGDVKVCYRIELQDETGKMIGEVLSGDGAKWKQGPVVTCAFFTGEVQDDALEIPDWDTVGLDDSDWNKCEIQTIPETEFFLADCPTDKVIRHLKPKMIHQTETTRIYDIGENISGYVVVDCKSKKPEIITMRVGEELTSDMLLEPLQVHRQQSEFRTAGVPKQYHTKFTWNAFRYIELSKNATAMDVAVVHSDIPVNSAFQTGNKTLQWMYDAYIRTQLCNMHAGIPSDCPHIERRGYTGDGQLTCEAGMMVLDSHDFYRKWIRDISDCQDRKSGHVQYTAPYTNCGGGPGGWGCAIVEVPYVYYTTYGELEPFAEMYPQMLRYFDYLDAHSENDLVTSDQPGDWCLGDWCTPGNKNQIPAPYVNNYFYIKSIKRILELAEVIGRQNETAALTARMQKRIDAILKNYYDETTGDFAQNIEGANSFAIDIGLGDARTFANMVEHYKQTAEYDTGIFGTDIVTRMLFENGQADLAFKLLTSKGTTASFYNWMQQGATTLWECWNGERSHSHPMFGSVVRYFFQYLLGIRQTPDSVSYRKLIIAPCLVTDLGSYSGHITTVNGKISVLVDSFMGTGEIHVTLDGDFDAQLQLGGRIFPLKNGKNRIRF